MFRLWILACFTLGWSGASHPEGIQLLAGRIAAVYYFAFFLSLPLIGKLEMRLFPKTVQKGISLVILIALTAMSFGPIHADEHAGHEVKQHKWSFSGPFGTFDKASLQRGFQVYKEVCTACHGISLLSFDDLLDIGFSMAQIKAIAAQSEIKDGPNDEGNMFKRPGRASDLVPPPFENEKAARFANNGAYPPDLSLITKARKGGPDYLFNLLTGYKEAPKDVKVAPGMHYNEAFPGNQIAMPAPLKDGLVTFSDGTKATTEQMAQDVVTFLSFVSEPEMEERKRMGVKVLIFLTFLTALFWGVKRSVWSRLEKNK
jgi:cytochrome c1